jgi:hypothetical protein
MYPIVHTVTDLFSVIGSALDDSWYVGLKAA